MTEQEFENLDYGQVLRHKYGGFYKLEHKTPAKSTVDGTRYVMYSHRWPHPYDVYVRPYDEFLQSFEVSSVAELWRVEGEFTQEELQQQIAENKRAAKEAKEYKEIVGSMDPSC